MSKRFDVWIKIDGEVQVNVIADSFEKALEIGRQTGASQILKLHKHVTENYLEVKLNGVTRAD